MHTQCPVLFPLCSPDWAVSWACSLLFPPWLFLASLLSFSSRILNFHDFSTGDCIFPSHMSCQTVGFPTIFSLKDRLCVPVALVCFHLDLIFVSLLYRSYLFEPVLRVLHSAPWGDPGFHYRALGKVFLSILLSWSWPLAETCFQGCSLHPALVVTL